MIAGLEEAKNPAGKSPPPDSGPLSGVEFGKNLTRLSRKFAAIPNRRFQSEWGEEPSGRKVLRLIQTVKRHTVFKNYVVKPEWRPNRNEWGQSTLIARWRFS